MTMRILVTAALLLLIAIPTIAASGSASDRADEPVPVPEPSDEAMRYYHSGNVLWVVNALWGFALPAALLFAGLSARMRDWARAAGRKWFFTIAIYAAIFTAVTFLLELPLAYYQGFVRPHAYDLSNQPLGKWLGDTFKGLALSIVFSSQV